MTLKATVPKRARSIATARKSKTAFTTRRISIEHLVIDERTKLVAQDHRVLKESGDRFQKTIVFCVDTEHAARMRQALVNENTDLSQQTRRYVMRITGDDAEGKAQLGQLHRSRVQRILSSSPPPLLSTGVDAQTCRLIVLDREVGSMTEFKQIIGRGTRVHEDTRKRAYFNLIDFRKATNHFADPEFDGDPVQIYEPGPEAIQSLRPMMYLRLTTEKRIFRRNRGTTKQSSSIQYIRT